MKLQSCLKVHHVKSPFPMFMSQNKSKVQNQFKIDQKNMKKTWKKAWKKHENRSEKHENWTISIIQFEISKLYI